MKPIPVGQQLVIHRSFVGLLFIYLGGFVLSAALLFALRYALLEPGTLLLASILGFAAAVTFLATVVQALAYSLANLTFTSQFFRVTTWPTIFASKVGESEWYQVQDVQVSKGGILAQLFDYGTLVIQSAGSIGYMRITYIPRVEYVRDLIVAQQEASGRPVTATPA